MRCIARQHWGAAPKQTLPVGSFVFSGTAGEAAARKPFKITTVIRILRPTHWLPLWSNRIFSVPKPV